MGNNGRNISSTAQVEDPTSVQTQKALPHDIHANIIGLRGFKEKDSQFALRTYVNFDCGQRRISVLRERVVYASPRARLQLSFLVEFTSDGQVL